MRKVEEKHFPNKTWPPAPPFTGTARRQTKQPSPEASVGAHQHISISAHQFLNNLPSKKPHQHISTSANQDITLRATRYQPPSFVIHLQKPSKNSTHQEESQHFLYEALQKFTRFHKVPFL